MRSLWFYASFLCILSTGLTSNQTYPTITTNKRFIYKRAQVEYEWSSTRARNDAIQRKEFIPNNPIIMDADYHGNAITIWSHRKRRLLNANWSMLSSSAPTNRYFITTPLFKPGTPATLSQLVQLQRLKPFPGLPIYNGTEWSCQGPFSVLRIYVSTGKLF